MALRNQILPSWDGVPLHAVTHSEIVKWVHELDSKGLAPGTVRYAYRILSLALSHAVRDGRLGRNPADGVKLPRVLNKDKRFLDHHQVEQLARASGEYALFVRLLT